MSVAPFFVHFLCVVLLFCYSASKWPDVSCLGTQLEAMGGLITVETAGPMTAWASVNSEGKMSGLQEHRRKISYNFSEFLFLIYYYFF